MSEGYQFVLYLPEPRRHPHSNIHAYQVDSLTTASIAAMFTIHCYESDFTNEVDGRALQNLSADKC